jgi:hypothetical protein
LSGQVLLLVSLFQNPPRSWWVIAGIALTGLLVLFIFLAGLLARDIAIVLSCLPFIALAIIYVWRFRSEKA